MLCCFAFLLFVVVALPFSASLVVIVHVHTIHLTTVQFDQLKQGRLAPSDCTWHLLERAGYVGSVTEFLRKIVEVRGTMDMSTDSTTDTEAAASMLQIIQDATVPTNEGYPLLICENIMAQTVGNLNRRAGQKRYGFLIKPVVKEGYVSQQKKFSDIGLHRLLLFNARTYVILECKPSVGMLTGGPIMNYVSQLFLEAIYMHKKENEELTADKQYQSTICILTDSRSWHIFMLNLCVKPITIQEYIMLFEEKNELIVQKVVDLLYTYVPEKCT